MDGLCKACRWWEGNPDDWLAPCKLTLVENGKIRYPESKAYAMSTNSSESDYLLTDSDFGCNQFERKEQ
jgi:hypothetical protein